MAIYSPEELANLQRPTNIPEAAVVGGVKALCRAAPYIAGYGLLTGNIPALAYGAGVDIACGLPLFPFPDPPPPPYYLPQDGGCLPIRYNVKIVVTTHSPDCVVNTLVNSYSNILGPVGRAITPWGNRSFSCREGQAFPGFNAFLQSPSGLVFQNVFFPDMGGVFSLSATPVSGSQNDSSCFDPITPSLPPGILPPPGYPDNPVIPGIEVPVPIYRPDRPTDPPIRWVPIVVPPIVLPVVVAPSFPINAPINIPVKIPISVNPAISGSLTIQVGTKGEIRTPPDLICPCEVGEPDLPAKECPPTTLFDIPFYKCGADKGFDSASIEVVTSSLPDNLFDELLSSSNLAQLGCDAIAPAQLAPVLLQSGRTDDLMLSPFFTNVLPDEVVSVELRITEYSPVQHREVTTFPGANQIKFGSVSYCLEGQQAGTPPWYVWDTKTYIRLPKRIKPGRLKILLKEAISFEVWDTGERSL